MLKYKIFCLLFNQTLFSHIYDTPSDSRTGTFSRHQKLSTNITKIECSLLLPGYSPDFL